MTKHNLKECKALLEAAYLAYQKARVKGDEIEERKALSSIILLKKHMNLHGTKGDEGW